MLQLFVPLALAVLLAAPVAAQTSFIAFESGPVRPLALSPDGTRLFAVNIPDNRLEIFAVSGGALSPLESVPVGMEPVAVAALSNSEVWVVNHLSDSVSVVDVASSPARVVRTLLVDDEPRDIVFAGTSQTGGTHAFITTARRGQHRTHSSIAGVPGAGDPLLTTAGVPRAEVWVFDTNDLDQGAPDPTLGGVPERILTLFGDTPRALATDGSTVYVGVLNSGNRTTTVSEGAVCDGFGTTACAGDGITSPNGIPGGLLPGGNPGPVDNHQGIPAPEVGLIVQFDPGSGEWRDEGNRNWSNGVRFFLPDKDVFAVDATSLAETASYVGVGTTLFNIAVNPANGTVYVSNTEAQNLTRFEGPGDHGGTTVQGNLAQSRVTLITQPGGAVKPRRLNQHLVYSQLPAPAGKKDHSLATPLEMAVSGDGATLYVAAFGSSKVGVFDTADLENDALFDGNPPDLDPEVESANYISLNGGGPAGLVLDESRNRLYVYTRFDNSVAVVDLGTGLQTASHPLFNPEPVEVVQGRPFLYDAFGTSSNGEASCASCHIFGDKDELAWDLGDPDADVTRDPIPRTIEPIGNVNGGAEGDEFHPMKGPMTTQTLKGMVNHGAMHWRGDRADGFFGFDDPYTGDADLSFRNFIVAFEGLVGGTTHATDPQLQADVQKFADFALRMTLPPNPVRALSNALTPEEQNGRNFYHGPISDSLFNCNGCHVLNPGQGFFGTDGRSSFEAEPQIAKIPHLRNMYTKVGMFGMPDVGFIAGGPTNLHQGDQVRGFGFLHDGSVDTVLRFLNAGVFQFPPTGNMRRDVEAFMLAFDSDLAPIVGQQVTDDGTPDGDVTARIALMRQRAAEPFPSQILGPGARECDLIVKGIHSGETRGWVFDPDDAEYDSDRAGEGPYTQDDLDAVADVDGQSVTYTCAPPGSGVRMGVDRDLDGILDADDGSPAVTVRVSGRKLLLRDRDDDASRRKIVLLSQDASLVTSGDPTQGGATLRVANPTPGGDDTTIDLPAANWQALGSPAGSRGYRYKDPAGACRAKVRAGKLAKVICRGTVVGFTLDEPSQGSLVATLQLATAPALCMEFGGTVRRDIPAQAGKTGTFLAMEAPPPASCPMP